MQQDFIWIRIGRRLYREKTKSIIFIEMENRACALYTDQHVYKFNSSLAGFLKKLPHGLLVKVNRSLAINMDRASSISRNEIVVAGKTFTLGKIHGRALYKQFKKPG